MSDKERFWARVHKTEGCWLWTAGKTGQGYGGFTVRLPDGSRKHWPAHVYAFTEANGPIAAGLFVLHSCDTPACVNPAHLRLGTQRDNIHDAIERGRWKAPPRQKSKRLGMIDYGAIRSRRAAGESPSSLARAFGISACHVTNIVARRKCV